MEVELLLMYLRPELFVLVAALYFIGNMLKDSSYVADELIPYILLAISAVLCALYIFAVSELSGVQSVLIAIFDVIIQAICCASGSVFIDQLFKQREKLLEKKIIEDKAKTE